MWYNSSMYKRLAIILILLLLGTACLAACRPAATTDNAIGWVQDAQPVLPTKAERVFTLPDGTRPVSSCADCWVVQDVETELFGIMDSAAQWTMPCQYRSMAVDEGFVLAQSRVDEEQAYTVATASGQVLAHYTDSVTIRAIGRDLCAVYTDRYAQVFDRNGTSYFINGALSPNLYFAACDDYLLGHDSATGAYYIWELYRQNGKGSAFLAAAYEQEDALYQVAYLGNSRFWIITSMPVSQASQQTYAQMIDGTLYRVRQQSEILDFTRSTEPTVAAINYVVLDIVNAYTPHLSLSARQSLPYQTNRTAVAIATLQTDGTVSSTCYALIANESLARTAAFPAGIGATGIRYSLDLGFVGAQHSDYSVALYRTDGSLAWQHRDAQYQAMSWQNGMYVCAKLSNTTPVYGAYDAEGRVAVPFIYDYLSPFIEGYAIAKQNGVYYRLHGTATTPLSITSGDWFLPYGCYTAAAADKQTLYNLQGAPLIGGIDDVIDLYRDDTGLVAVIEQDNAITLYRLQ